MSETAENTLEPFGFQRDTDYAKITEPFKGCLLKRKPLAEHLTRYIDRLQVGAVLALDARWGEGKTWFVQNWKAYLEQTEKPHNVIYLNAFTQDYLEDPFMVLAAEISHAFDTANDEHPLIQSFKDQAINATKALLPELPKLMLSLGITLMGAGYLGKTLENAVSTAQDAINTTKETYGDEVFDGINETINENIQEAIKERFEKHETDKQTLESFKQSLSTLAANKDLNPKPLVFIIDELDRCNPLFSVRLIERIKHFFDIPNIVFVLVTDKTQLQATICHQFGYNEAASEAYLDKFVDFSIKLERPKNIDRKDEYLQIFSTTLTNLGFSDEEVIRYQYFGLIFSTISNTSIRQIKKILNRFSLLYLKNEIKDVALLYKLFFPNLDNQIPLFMHMIYDFSRYFDKNLVTANSDEIEKFIKEKLFSFEENFQEYRSTENNRYIESTFRNNVSQATGHFFMRLLTTNYSYLKMVHFNLSTSHIDSFWHELSITPVNLPLELNTTWSAYINTGLKE